MTQEHFEQLQADVEKVLGKYECQEIFIIVRDDNANKNWMVYCKNKDQQGRLVPVVAGIIGAVSTDGKPGESQQVFMK